MWRQSARAYRGDRCPTQPMSDTIQLVRTQLWRLFAGVAVMSCLILVAGNALGVPLLVGFVETGSMEPTIRTGDGFVSLPPAITGSPSTGDVVVFDAQELEGGGLTTHRIIEETSDGYITQGDANMAADQEGREPPVSESQIVAVAWQPGDDVVTIPQLGTAAMAIQSTLTWTSHRLSAQLGVGLGGMSSGPSLLLIGGVGLVVLSFVLEWRSAEIRERSRSTPVRVDPRTVLVIVGLVVCLTTFGAMGSMSSTTEISIISAEYESDRPDVVPTGETGSQPYTVSNGGLLPVVSVLESTDGAVELPQRQTVVSGGNSEEIAVSVTAPPETGYYSHQLTEHRYFGVLPTPVIMLLHAIHPMAAMAVVTMTVGGIVMTPLLLLRAASPVRTRSRDRPARSERGFW